MPILLPCKCGKKLRVPESAAGKKIRCPACGAVETVPSSQVEEEEVPVVEPIDEIPEVEPAEEEPDEEPEEEAAYWTHPSSTDSIVALSDEALYVANLSDADMKKAEKRLRRGDPPAMVLDGAKAVIPYELIRKVESNVYHASIEVTWGEEGLFKEKEETNIHCADQAARDEILEALHDRLGPRWQRRKDRYSPLRAAVAPLVVIGFFSLLTFLFFMAGRQQAEGTGGGGTRVVRTRGLLGVAFVAVYNFIGPVGVCVLGGLFVAAGLAWLVARVAKPPIMITLTPEGGAAPKRRKKRPPRD